MISRGERERETREGEEEIDYPLDKVKKKECVKEATGALRIDSITCADKRLLLQIKQKKRELICKLVTSEICSKII